MAENLALGLAVYVGLFFRTTLGFWAGLVACLLLIFVGDKEVGHTGWLVFFTVLCLVVMFASQAMHEAQRDQEE
ncbi:general stress protein CsbA [Natronospira proteinivora]|uniref:General stress protein CsbA n=1 Tax=Natronospira proteinivora TaxID=1807133 RepID=A0ABT1G987_9GAMM|nr:hypothetical protein [Natronospira proteinivora]MCP1727602.1 general stress protein CsbA [Natronospira proteinivora]